MRQTIIATAPTGARKTKNNHANLPITEDEILWAAETCLEAGSPLFHLHVRDEEGKHTIESRYYEPILNALMQRFSDDLIVQISTEGCGMFNQEDQMQCVMDLQPEAVSLGLKELVPAFKEAKDKAGMFFSELENTNTHYQFILYRPGDVTYLSELMEQGIVPNRRHSVLFVLGSYDQTIDPEPYDLISFLSVNKKNHHWMTCAFGQAEIAVTHAAVALGGDVRVGFENNLHLPSGKLAWSNKELVEAAKGSITQIGKQCADAKETRRQLAGLKSE